MALLSLIWAKSMFMMYCYWWNSYCFGIISNFNLFNLIKISTILFTKTIVTICEPFLFRSLLLTQTTKQERCFRNLKPSLQQHLCCFTRKEKSNNERHKRSDYLRNVAVGQRPGRDTSGLCLDSPIRILPAEIFDAPTWLRGLWHAPWQFPNLTTPWDQHELMQR